MTELHDSPKNNRFGFFPIFLGRLAHFGRTFFMTATRDVLSNFKFRASWGSIGNQIILLADGSPDNYPYIPEMAPGLTNWLVDGQRPTTLSTPPMVSSAFTWEKVYTLDFGVDFGFLIIA